MSSRRRRGSIRDRSQGERKPLLRRHGGEPREGIGDFPDGWAVRGKNDNKHENKENAEMMKSKSKNKPPVLRGDEWRKAHPKNTRKGGRPQNPIKVGTRFGRLEVVGIATPKNRRSRSVCKCDCGKTVTRTNTELRRGLQSCGCLLSDAHMKHGGSRRGHRERLWEIFNGIKARCEHPKSNIYKYYGGRGISICRKWRDDYTKFREWALKNGYKDGLSIDRINPDGNYEPGNCRWITQREQCLNKRNNLRIEIDGEKKLVIEWCEKFGTPEKLARSRISEGKKGIDIFVPPYRLKGGAR